MCQIDWRAIADWITAIGTWGLVFVAIGGYFIWRKQFFKQRDHDLALRMVRNHIDCVREMEIFRTQNRTVRDAPGTKVSDIGWEEANAMYDARRLTLSDFIILRVKIESEASLVWVDIWQELGELNKKWGRLDSRVMAETKKYVLGLDSKPDDAEEYDPKIVFGTSDDSVGQQYLEIMTEIFLLIEPKLQMN